LYQWLDLAAPWLALVALAAAAAALAWGLRQHRQLRSLSSQYQALTFDTQGGSLEQVLADHLDNVRAARAQTAEALGIVRQMERLAASHIQHLGLVRYNPFSHTGSDQSFVLILADRDGNGAVVNSLHAREGTRIYAKPLAAWQSIYTLTEEEEEAIGRARGQAPVSVNGNGKVS